MRSRILGKLGCAVLVLSPLVVKRPAQAQTYVIMYEFTGSDGAVPFGELLLNGGVLYGTTSGGGAYNAGTVFQFDTTTEVETVLYSFAGGPADGADPIAGLVRDSNGNMYGVTYGGGASFFGTIFEIPVAGGFTLLYSFQGPPGDGAGPSGRLVLAGGSLFGTTYAGGSGNGSGTVFKLAGGIYTSLRDFPPGGTFPRAGLTLEGGHLYGVAYDGGLASSGGTVFELTPAAPLYAFTGGDDGGRPMASLIGDGLGNLYGTASEGGSGTFGNGHGVVFELNVTTLQQTLLHTFTGLDGTGPVGALVRDSSGNLYGTTMFGGTAGHGTVFKLDTSGNLTTLHSFPGGPNGGNPAAGLVLDTDGNLWGLASAGGFGYGLIFEITPGT
ncbi:MAG TPA: choice-of-anchor tandem repeat GloVer-containing protein [Bryobacteraceae bacterium]|nr:choice-of-anchor tandem repeat GloVer-containing protein [Bryobacteraceae bacterium]